MDAAAAMGWAAAAAMDAAAAVNMLRTSLAGCCQHENTCLQGTLTRMHRLGRYSSC